jgi:hypothetical protein
MTRGLRFGIAALVGGCGFDSSGATGGSAASTGTEGSTSTADDGEASTTTSQSASTGAATSTGADESGDVGATSGGSEVDSTGAGDPCAVDNGGCDDDATCSIDDHGEVVCTCHEGFEGDGSECTVVPALEMLRWELPCGVDLGLTCSADMNAMDSAVLVGEPGVIYAVELRIRGVLEQKAYSGGMDDGFWYEGGDPVFDAGWNATSLVISDPPQVFRYNNGPSSVWECVLVDVTRTVYVTAGATVSISVDTGNAIIVDNDSGVVVPDVDPAPEAFDGQFAQVDIVSIQL